jgi:hypothetical protein
MSWFAGTSQIWILRIPTGSFNNTAQSDNIMQIIPDFRSARNDMRRRTLLVGGYFLYFD